MPRPIVELRPDAPKAMRDAIERALAKRRGRLYLDSMQNGYGKTVVAPYSLRAIDGANLSTTEAVREHHSRGESHHAGVLPAAVLFPESTAAVQAIVRACAAHRCPIVPFGAETTLFGLLDEPLPLQVTDVNVAVLVVFAIASMGVYGIFLAGWSSNSKYSLLGALRSAAQMISYELSYGLSLAGVLLIANALRGSGGYDDAVTRLDAMAADLTKARCAEANFSNAGRRGARRHEGQQRAIGDPHIHDSWIVL